MKYSFLDLLKIKFLQFNFKKSQTCWMYLKDKISVTLRQFLK